MGHGDSVKLWYLNRINLLKDLPPEELQFIAQCSRMGKHSKGEIIFFQGDPALSVYFLKEGRVKLSSVGVEGREITLAILDPGEIFGELSVSGIEKSNVQAQAMQETVICAIGKEDFLRVVERNSRLALKLTKFLGFRRYQIERRLEDLVFKDVPTRLAGLLAVLKDQYGQQDPRGIRLGIVLSHQELANLVGTTRETVSAFLARWKKEGVLDSEGRHIIIMNEKNLQDLAQTLSV